jgi:hypothetical protein
MDWIAAPCAGCYKNNNQTITGVEINRGKPLGPIADPGDPPSKGEASDFISIEPGTITQWWSVDGKQVQEVLPSGELTWGVQIVVHGGIEDPPTYSPAPSIEPPQ